MARRLSIAAKFFLTHLVVAGIALFVAGAVGFLFVRGIVTSDADKALVGEARLMAEAFRPLLATKPLPLERIAQEGDLLGKISGSRVTIVLPDGTVVADSTVGAAGIGGMENHAEHAEIREALRGQPGYSQRRSITVREEMRYVALPIVQGSEVLGVARAAVPAAILDRRLWQITAVIWGTGLAALLLILAGAGYLARKITVPLAQMQAAAREMGSGNLSHTLQIRTGDEVEEMSDAMNRMASQLASTIHQLETEKARLMALLASLSDGVIVVAPDRSVRMMNLAAGRILDVSETMGEGRPYAEVVRLPQVLSFIDGWVRGENPKPRDISLPTRAGGRAVRISGTAVSHPGESGADVVLTLRDITEESRLSQIKSDFVSNASHELRTPLTTIRGYIEAARDSVREGGTPDPAFLDTAHASTLRMERLIDDLLELSRAESG
ncbi:MAG: histidine kinase dimerization/phospho-acceptor domain-containing protein, partial [Verrucomicrobiota bacterium]